MANATQYIRLENRLVFLAWLNSLFGYEKNRDLLRDTREVAEGFDGDGQSFMLHHVRGRGEAVKISQDDLACYDANIKAHLDAINAHRPEPITLRYFQYLSLLYAEVFLDAYFNRRGELLRVLNAFVRDRNARKAPGDVRDALFSEADLRKVAYWMATGSGKTLIMHFNYRQFLHYNTLPLDNILLITPNEGLSEQHLLEMEASGIPCERFSLEESGLGLGERNVVRATEITKLVEEKRGGGVSVDVEAFEGNNLIFVDEGHKGSGGVAWRHLRDRLEQTGFTFEYSATFGQALTAARNDELTAEYGKSILFDYSYKYFHGDGFGKDFHVLNLKEETDKDQTDALLAGNLLSFYEQQRCFAEQAASLRPYNLESPLWVFVGSRVNAVYTEDRRPRSDVLTVARFLHRFLSDRTWAEEAIARLIEGRTGLVDANREDVFAGRLEYLRGGTTEPREVYDDVLRCLFHATGGGGLHMADMRGSAGELGLKVSGAEEYFGLIYIGDASRFKKLVEEHGGGITLEEDAISGSLFEPLNRPDSPINMLIGAKKFMEGWNSWRVSNMGLLNIGRAEGSGIIQLFGRGVRLRGLDFSLKRSTALDGEHPPHIRLLERLNIFAVRANYMAQFRDYLEREGVEVEGHIEFSLPIRRNEPFLKKGLVIPQLPEGTEFTRHCDFCLASDPAARVTVDMSIKAVSMESTAGGLRTVTMAAGQEYVIPSESLAFLDWDDLYLALLEYKEQKGFDNLVVRPEDLPAILEEDDSRLYRLVADESVVRPESFAGVAKLRDAVLSILRKYMEKYYRVRQERWDSEHMTCAPLGANHPNFQDYTVGILRSEEELLRAVKGLIDEGERIYREETWELPNVHFDRHLYQPLLIEQGDRVKITPRGLEPSERRFVEDLRTHFRQEADKSLAAKEIFLLRNLSRGKGVGFFENEGFYPDFILWVKEGDQQRIVFVEPHGMRQEKAYWTSDKARLHERLREFSERLRERGELQNVRLDSFIISKTPYEELQQIYGDGTWDRGRFAAAHILFFGDEYVGDLFAKTE